MVRRRQSGYVLLVALFVMAAALSAVAIVAAALSFRMGLVRQEARDLHLTALTDAAVARALAELSRNPDYRGTFGNEPFGNGKIAIEVERVGSTRVVVEVWAAYGTGGRAARADVAFFPLRVTAWEPVTYLPYGSSSSGASSGM